VRLRPLPRWLHLPGTRPLADDNPWVRVRTGLLVLVGILTAGTVGYVLLGLAPLDALYQVVTTVTTVGFRELGETDAAWKVFTIVLVLTGTGTVLYLFGVLLETLVEGRLGDEVRRRRMKRELDELAGHVVVCGWGQVGQAICHTLVGAGDEVVVVDRRDDVPPSPSIRFVTGDATDDDVLRRAGIERARALVVALDTDAGNVYVTLSGRSMRADLFIVARATSPSAEEKLYRAGADRVVNPHAIGGTRMAALITAPHVADFLDVVMHDRELVVRIAEHDLPAGASVTGRSIADCHIGDLTGATLLAIRGDDGRFVTHPEPGLRLSEGDVLIVLGTEDQHASVEQLLRR
jgi:voltage-gated potassium channel